MRRTTAARAAGPAVALALVMAGAPTTACDSDSDGDNAAAAGTSGDTENSGGSGSDDDTGIAGATTTTGGNSSEGGEGGKNADGGSGGDSGATGVNLARPFAADSPWNTPTPANTEWYDVDVLHHCYEDCMDSDGLRHWWVGTEFGITWSLSSDPLWTFDLPAYTADSWHRTRAAKTLQMHAPSTLAPWPEDDGMILVADATTGDFVELWQASVDAANKTVTGQVWATDNIVTGLGVGDATTNLNGGTRASNFSWAAGNITQADLTAGKINHALEITLPLDMLAGSNDGPGPYCAPATSGNGNTGHGPIVMGSKIGIPADESMPAGLSDIGRMVFDALQTYGGYVGDGCGGDKPVIGADGPSMGLSHNASIDDTPFEPLIAFWNHGGSADMETIGELLRIADYCQPAG
jgi:hypothetical protein